MSEVGVPAAAAATPSDLPAPPEQIDVTSGPMKVEVTLPSGEIACLIVDKSTPVMDFIVQLTRAHKLNTTDHILTVLSEETGRPVDYASGQLIGPLLLLRGRKRLSLLSKAELKKEQERKAKEYRSAAKFETTYRVLVNLPRGVKAVYRMRLDLPVSEAFTTACADKGLDPARHFVSLPGAPAVPIDMATPLAACGKNEICIVERPTPPPKANGSSGVAATGSVSAQAFPREDVPQMTTLRLSQLPSSPGESTRASFGGEVVNHPLVGSASLSQSAPGSPQVRSAARPLPPGAKPSRKKYAAPPPPPTAPAVAPPVPASSSPANGPLPMPMTAVLYRQSSLPNGQPAVSAATELQLKDETCHGVVLAHGSSSGRMSVSDGPDGGCRSSIGGGSLSRHNSSDASSVSDAHSLSSGVGATDLSSAESCSESMPPPPPPLPGALVNAAGFALGVELTQQQPSVDYDSDELSGEAQTVIAGRKASTSSASSKKSAKARAPSLPLRPPSPEIEISAL